MGLAGVLPWLDHGRPEATARRSPKDYRPSQRPLLRHLIESRLKKAIIEEARRLGFHTLVARVAEGSEESLHLNMSMGFVHIGTLKEVGRKFNRLIDVHILQKMLGRAAHDK